MLVLVSFISTASMFGQEAAEHADSPWLTALITWAPFIFLIGLWLFFMKRMNVYGKGGAKAYMQVTQETMQRIDTHLADIASSLRKIADRESSR
jgi:ATP-dependent Zn protease